MLRRNEEVGIRRALRFEVEGVTGRGCPRLGWREQVEKNSESRIMVCWDE